MAKNQLMLKRNVMEKSTSNFSF